MYRYCLANASHCTKLKGGHIPKDRKAFEKLVHKLWFEMYSRGHHHRGQQNSSGFEHVFVGEISEEGEVSGFHNWIQFYNEEKKGAVDYRG